MQYGVSSLLSALLAPMILVIGFSFFRCAFNVKSKLPSVQHNVLFGFIGRKTFEGNMGTVVEVIYNHGEHFHKLRPIANGHAV